MSCCKSNLKSLFEIFSLVKLWDCVDLASTIISEVMTKSELNIDELWVDEMKEKLRKLNLPVSGSKAISCEQL